MKSWLKALLISVLVLAGCILYLPTLAKQGINALLPWAMQQAGLKQGQASISQLSWKNLNIDQLQFFSPAQNSQIKLQDINITFSPWSIASGQVHDVTVEHIKVEVLTSLDKRNTHTHTRAPTNNKIHRTQPELASNSSAETTEFEMASLEQIFQQLPINHLTIKHFQLIHPQAIIEGRIAFNKQQLSIHNTIQTDRLTKTLSHQFTLDSQGDMKSLIFIEQQTTPIFNLRAHWQLPSDPNKPALLSLQQSADIQSWLTLLEHPKEQKKAHQNQAHTLTAKVAIESWNLEFSLPRVIENQQQLLSQLSATGLLQIKMNDLNVFDHNKKANIIEHVELAINMNTQVDPQQEEQWQFSLDTFDLTGKINSLAPINFTIEQSLKKAILLSCAFKQESSHCQWQGKLAQKLSGEQLTHTTELTLEGQFSREINQASQFISQQILSLSTQQENPLWPKFNNESQGKVIVQGQHNNNNWHWQLNLPYGFNNQSQYLDTLFADKPNAQLAEVHWQLLPGWLIEGINNEITQAKEFSIVIAQLKWQHEKKLLRLENAQVSCNLDWLKLQYSPQLRSQQALSQLPLACHWQMKNQPSQWNQWPVPALLFKGNIDLSSVNLNQAKLTTSMSLSGLADSLDLTLLAQHDFNNLQQGSAQLYLKNLKLDWKKMGLMKMAELTQTQLLEGSISAQGWVQWQQYQKDIFDDSSIAWRWQPDLMLRIDDISGVYKELTTWQDIDVQLAIRRPFYTDFRIDSQVSALSINPGINIANVLARSTTTIQADFSQALIVIEEVHTDVLGGRINVPVIRFDTRQEINAFSVEIEGLQIEQIAALEAGAGITASGELDGVLPIILLPEGPKIPTGSLYARAPGGIVQFRGTAADNLKQSDPSVDLAMQVLDDFRYDKLQTDINYQSDGELNLVLQFQGYNPTFFNGQATHFNLNLEYNLLDLLESLRISNDIVQKLENKYQ
jgi:hypothetical protein